MNLLLLCGLLGCGDVDGVSDDDPILDAGPPSMDAAPSADSGSSIESGVDGGPTPATDGGSSVACEIVTCDPRDPDASCDASEQCLLASEDPSCEDPLTVLRTVDEQCFSAFECEPGLACFLRLGEGRCGRVCCPSLSEDPICGEERCAPLGTLLDGTEAIETDWGVCVGQRPCDVLDPAATCEPSEGCYIVSPSGETDCLTAGDAAEDEECTQPNDCSPGYFCAGLNMQRCVRICDLDATSGPTACDETESCMAFSYSPDGTGICTAGG